MRLAVKNIFVGSFESSYLPLFFFFGERKKPAKLIKIKGTGYKDFNDINYRVVNNYPFQIWLTKIFIEDQNIKYILE